MSSGSSISYRMYNMNQDVTHKTHCDCEAPYPIPVQLLNDLHEENKALNKMNKISGVMEDSSKQMSNNSNNQMVKDLKADLTFVKSKLKMYDRLLLVVVLCVVFLSLDVYEEDEINTGYNGFINSSNSSTSLERTSLELSNGPSIASVHREGPSQEFLKWYEYFIDEDTTDMDTTDKDTIDEDTTDEDSTDKDITDKNTTDEDTIDESYFPKSKGKNVQRAKNPTLKVIFKSPIPIKGCVIGLANAQTWDNIVKKFGIKNLRNCEDTGNGKRKV
ncbi:hypothetical protein Tco_0740759 [Tanacetum coccineum]